MKLRVRVQVGPTTINTHSRLTDVIGHYCPKVPAPVVECGEPNEILVTLKAYWEPQHGTPYSLEMGQLTGLVLGCLGGMGVETHGHQVEEFSEPAR